MNDSAQTLYQNSDLNRFELESEGSIAFIDYTIRHGLLFLIHTEVPAALRGKGIGNIIVEKVLEYAKQNNYKIVPICPFIQTYLKRHPEWKDIEAPNAERYLNRE